MRLLFGLLCNSYNEIILKSSKMHLKIELRYAKKALLDMVRTSLVAI